MFSPMPEVFPTSPFPLTNLGGATGSYVSDLTWPGFVKCLGTITTTFHWVTDYPDELPPESALIVENSNASASFYNGTIGTCTASDGLGDPQKTDYITESGIGVSSSGTHYWIKDHPGVSFTIHCTPASEASPDTVDTFCAAGISYRAQAEPIILGLGGILSSNGTAEILIGQGCAAALSVGSFTSNLSNYQWTVTGYTFDHWEVAQDQSYGRLWHVPAAIWQTPVPHWYWQKDGSVVVSVSATLTVNGQTVPITAQKSVTVVAPHSFSDAHPGVVQYTDNETVVEAGNPDETPGMTFHGWVSTPDRFVQHYGGGGNWAWLQLCNTYCLQWNWFLGVQRTYGTDGEWDLDTQFPYTSQYIAGDVEDYNPTLEEDSDSPSFSFPAFIGWYVVNDNFAWYTMYLPPGPDSSWVPVHVIQWNWSASDDNSAPIGAGPFSKQSPNIGTISILADEPWWQFPIWETKHVPAH